MSSRSVTARTNLMKYLIGAKCLPFVTKTWNATNAGPALNKYLIPATTHSQLIELDCSNRQQLDLPSGKAVPIDAKDFQIFVTWGRFVGQPQVRDERYSPTAVYGSIGGWVPTEEGSCSKWKIHEPSWSTAQCSAHRGRRRADASSRVPGKRDPPPPPPPKKKNKREEDGVLKTLAAWVAEKETMLRRKGLPSADDFGLLFIFFPERRMTDYWPSRFSPVVSTVAALRVVYFPTGVCCSWIASWLAATVRNGFVGCYEEMSEIALRNETTRTRKNRG